MSSFNLVDTHCHINIMVKNQFDTALTDEQLPLAEKIVADASQHHVTRIINVGTSVIESTNCVILANKIAHCFAAIGVHPNDCTPEWRTDIQALKKLLAAHGAKIVAIGECGLDFHYPDYESMRQKDAFRSQIELALQANLPLIVHTRQAPDETLAVLDEFKDTSLRGVIHCFSEDRAFAQHVMQRGFLMGIGGPLTYPKNEELRLVFAQAPLSSILLETDAPYLAPQTMRGKQNSPSSIYEIAQFLAELRNEKFEDIANQTTKNATLLFDKMR